MASAIITAKALSLACASGVESRYCFTLFVAPASKTSLLIGRCFSCQKVSSTSLHSTTPNHCRIVCFLWTNIWVSPTPPPRQFKHCACLRQSTTDTVVRRRDASLSESQSLRRTRHDQAGWPRSSALKYSSMYATHSMPARPRHPPRSAVGGWHDSRTCLDCSMLNLLNRVYLVNRS